jgi:chromosome segregation ATPase
MWKSPRLSDVSDVRSLPESQTLRPSAPSPDPESTGGAVAAESAAVESANAEIEFVSSAIEDLQSRLERASTQMNQVTAVRATEREIGLLFVEAQKFTEAALAKLEGQIHQILDQAEAKAAEIVREAQEEGEELRRQAQSATLFPVEKVHELQAAIRGFSTINGELVKELSALNTMLSPSSERGIHAALSTNGTGSPS